MRRFDTVIVSCCLITVAVALWRNAQHFSPNQKKLLRNAFWFAEEIVPVLKEKQQQQQQHHSPSNLEIPDASNNTIQTLCAVAAEPGLLVAFGTPEISFPHCPVLRFKLPNYGSGFGCPPKNPCLVLQVNQTFFEPLHSQHIFGGSGVLVATSFRVPQDLWRSMISASSSSTTKAATRLKLWDRIANTTQEIQALVDPALRDQQVPHFLSVTTTIRKHYRSYQGLGQMGNRTTTAKPFLWDDDQVMKRLDLWLEYYRRIGASHFYVIDNEPAGPKNLPIESRVDVTYIRAPSMLYDVWNCKRNAYTVAGQAILENTVIRMAHTQWLLSVDVDEFIVVGDDDRFNQSLVGLLRYYENVYCDGSGGSFHNLTCRSLNATAYDAVYALVFSAFLLRADGVLHAEVDFQRKALVRASLTDRLDVHYPAARDATRHALVKVPPRQGWMAHYNHALDRSSHDIPGSSPGGLDRFFETLKKRTKTLRSK